jgi:hypothetical protein
MRDELADIDKKYPGKSIVKLKSFKNNKLPFINSTVGVPIC